MAKQAAKERVLILILLDNALREQAAREVAKVETSLNPYSIG